MFGVDLSHFGGLIAALVITTTAFVGFSDDTARNDMSLHNVDALKNANTRRYTHLFAYTNRVHGVLRTP